MKKKLENFQKLTLLLTFLLIPSFIDAQNPKITVNGITYGITSLENLTVEVAIPENNMAYSGKIVVPTHITFKGRKFKVIGIGEFAFEKSHLSEVVLHNGITYLDKGAFVDAKIKNLKLPNSIKSLGYSSLAIDDIFNNLTIPNTITDMWGSGPTIIKGTLKIEDGIIMLNSDGLYASTLYIGRTFKNNKIPDIMAKHIIISDIIQSDKVILDLLNKYERGEILLNNYKKERHPKLRRYPINITGERIITLQHSTPPQIQVFENKLSDETFVHVKLRVPKVSLEAYQNHSIWGKFLTIEGF